MSIKISQNIQQQQTYIDAIKDGYRPETVKNLSRRDNFYREITYVKEIDCCERTARIAWGCFCSLACCCIPLCSEEFKKVMWEVGAQGIKRQVILHLDEDAADVGFEEDLEDETLNHILDRDSAKVYFSQMENMAKLKELCGHYYYTYIAPSGLSLLVFIPYMNLDKTETIVANFDDGSFFSSGELEKLARQHCKDFKLQSFKGSHRSNPYIILNTTTGELYGQANTQSELSYLLAKIPETDKSDYVVCQSETNN